jgi:predicted site-specific integrase-resolvase
MMEETTGCAIALADEEAARLLSISASTLRAWRSQGRGPAYIRAGRRIVYRVSDLEAFLGANRVEPGSR